MAELPGWRLVALAVLLPAIGLQIGLESVLAGTEVGERLAGIGAALLSVLVLGAAAAYLSRPVDRSRTLR